MPDPFDPDFDAARRALDEVPAPDLWAEAERRAEDGAVVPLVADGERVRRHPGRWLAVAAVAALAVGTVGVLTSDDDDGEGRRRPVRRGPDGNVRDLRAWRTSSRVRHWSCGSRSPPLAASSSTSRTSKVARASTAT